MGKNKRKVALDQPSSTPRWPTQVRGKMPGGRLLGNNSMWLYKSVPMSPVVDAVSPAATWQAAEPLLSAFEEIASITPVGVPARRFANRGKYRQVHLLLVNVPTLYRPHPGRLSSYLGSQFHGAVTQRRVLLFGVRLSASMDYTSKEALRSLADDLWYGRTSPGAFDEDFALVEPALERAGLRTPRPEEVRLADSWWNQGHYPDVPYLPTFNHMYFFGSAESAKIAEKYGNDPADWPQIDDKHAVTFMSLQDPPVDRPQNASSASVQWVSRLLNTGALAVSLRGGVEPARVTYGELRHKRKAFLADLDDRLKSGAMDRHEQQQLLGQLESMEQVYADGGPPTFTDASVVAAVSGRVHDADMLSGQAGLHLRPMDYLQKSAFYETMLCSDSRANPHLHDMPSHAVAASGLPSLSKVGDTDGALLGFTEEDRQPALLEPVAASRTDREPILVVPGSTGAGKTLSMLWLANQFTKMSVPSVFLDPKALALDTCVPTPHGWSPIADIAAGDMVIGGDGKPCRVVATSPVFTEPDLYRINFNDGQSVVADADHQWTVLSMSDRHAAARRPGRVRRQLALAAHAETLRALASHRSSDEPMTARQLHDAVTAAGVHVWGAPEAVRTALVRNRVLPVDEIQPARWEPELALKQLAESVDPSPLKSSVADHARVRTTAQLVGEGLRTNAGHGQAKWAVPTAGPVDLPHRHDLLVDPYLLGVWLGDGTSKNGSIACSSDDTDAMMGNLREVWPTWKIVQDKEGLDLLRAVKSDPDRCRYGHECGLVARSKGRKNRYCPVCNVAYQHGGSGDPPVNSGLGHLLGDLGLIRNKHIPDAYMFSSSQQRFALLQGLMDTDGTFDKKRRECRITLADERLACDTLSLIRSLGYRATMWECKTSWTHEGRRRRGAAFTVTFRTSDPVFRLPRKRDGVVGCGRSREEYTFITSIERVESQPAKCLVVDSPDRTFLCADWLVTHNSGSDHSDAVTNVGGQVYSLDQLSTADGVFDPVRFSPNPETAVDLAASAISTIDPFGSRKDELEADLINALRYGVVERGATCTGQALQIALADGEAGSDGEWMVDQVLKRAKSTLASAVVGLDPAGEPLRTAEGLSLVKVGDMHLPLPDPKALELGGQRANMTQRTAMAVVRMMVFGATMALAGRGGGVLLLDEGWVFLRPDNIAEVEMLGRVARAFDVLPIIMTQRVSDTTKVDLENYISRGLILPMGQRSEAVAALEMFGLDPSPQRVDRLVAPKSKSHSADDEGLPNWDSMHTLKDPESGEVLRGTIGIYVDLVGRAVPVEMTIPDEFVWLASTNPDDVAARRAWKAQQGHGHSHRESAA